MRKFPPKLTEYREQLDVWLNRFVQFMVDVIYDRRRQGRLAELTANLLYGLSFIFHALVRLRWYLYEKIFLSYQTFQFSLRVLSKGPLQPKVFLR